jgi:hypothetical protein
MSCSLPPHPAFMFEVLPNHQEPSTSAVDEELLVPVMSVDDKSWRAMLVKVTIERHIHPG